METHALVVLNKYGHSLSVFDVERQAEVFTLPTSPFPHEVCLGPERRYAYVSEYGLAGVDAEGEGGNTIGVYDLQRRQRVGSLVTNAFRRPHGVAAHASGVLFVTSEPSRALLMFDVGTRTLTRVAYLEQDCPHMTCVSPDGRTVFAANIGSNSITAVDVGTGAVLGHVTLFGRPEGMAFSLDGRTLYVANREGGAVAIVDVASRAVVGRIETGAGPVRIGLTPDGRFLAFPLFHADAVQIADPTTRALVATIPVGRRPAGMAISPDSRLLFVSCEAERAVYVVSFEAAAVVGRLETGEGPDAMVCLMGAELQ